MWKEEFSTSEGGTETFAGVTFFAGMGIGSGAILTTQTFCNAKSNIIEHKLIKKSMTYVHIKRCLGLAMFLGK